MNQASRRLPTTNFRNIIHPLPSVQEHATTENEKAAHLAILPGKFRTMAPDMAAQTRGRTISLTPPATVQEPVIEPITAITKNGQD
jgi:hypothetical protein